MAKVKKATKKKAAKKKAPKKKAPAKKKIAKKKAAPAAGLDVVKIANQQRHIKLLAKLNDPNDYLTKKETAELDQFENPPNPNAIADKVYGRLLPNQAAAARYAGVTVKTIYNWKTKGGMPLVGDQYSTNFLDAWKANEGSPESDLQSRNKTLEADLKELKIQRLGIDLAEIKGTLVSIDEVKTGQITRIQEVKRVLNGVGRKLAPQLKGKSMREMTTIIEAAMKQVLRTFSGE